MPKIIKFVMKIIRTIETSFISLWYMSLVFIFRPLIMYSFIIMNHLFLVCTFTLEHNDPSSTLPEAFTTSHTLTHIKSCTDTQNHAQTHKIMHKHTKSCTDTQNHAQTHRNLNKHKKITLFKWASLWGTDLP